MKYNMHNTCLLFSDQPLKQVPFMVRRTKSNNLPVYLDYRNGRARILTIIRKIEGDPLVW